MTSNNILRGTHMNDTPTSSPSPHGGRGTLPSHVSKLPLYAYKKDEGIEKGIEHSVDQDLPISFLHLLLGQWDDKMRRGLFRYDVTLCETKVIPGSYGFIAQLNEGRLNKRPTEFRVDQVLQPFDDKKFNFTKIGQEEALLRFEPSNDNRAHYYLDAPISYESESPNIITINVSPIEYGHVLLVPRIFNHLPQMIDHDSLFSALHFAKEAANPFFRVGYNSLGALATINHLHFQAYYLEVSFPVEKSPAWKICEANGVAISQLQKYPIRGLIFEGGNTIRDLSDVVASSCLLLQDRNIPFNILISGCDKRVFLFPRCFSKKQALVGQVSQDILDTQVKPAVWEISGHIVLKRKQDYDDVSEEYVCSLLAEVSLSDESFEEVKAIILEALGGLQTVQRVVKERSQEASVSSSPKNCSFKLR